MPLSRLDNFLKNVKGNILYVDPNNLDATDGVENQGNSQSRPFQTLQRALIEASRFSYQVGIDNDRFERTTIYLAPGTYLIDNRPGWIPDGANNFLLRNGQTSSDFTQFSATTDFDINNPNNILYKFNSIYGGVIVPRGVSIVGTDLRKVKLKPLYVPNPSNPNIPRSAILRLTGATYCFQFTLFDSPKTRGIYKDFTNNTFDGNFSHHKLTCFEFADGATPVNINDSFMTYETDRTDLDMYYEKVGLAYGPSSGRNISPNYPSPGVDIQPRIDEFRIVGPVAGESGISSIKAGDGNTATTLINVKTEEPIFGLNVNTEVIINNVPDDAYNGTFSVVRVLDAVEAGVTEFEYKSSLIPNNALPNPAGTSVDLSTDTVASASPYVFSVSLRSVYGMCGMHADGAITDGFKSMVVAQFTGISLQLDDNAFVLYNPTSGTYEDDTTVENLHTNINAKYKPAYENYHIKASNNSFMQLVSVFAVGYAEHFVTESGGDFSLTNSNSNFGQRALRSDGFRDTAYPQDNYGYLTQSIPPQFVEPQLTTVEFFPINVGLTTNPSTGIGNTSRLYIYDYKNPSVAPPSLVQGYRFGAREQDQLVVAYPLGPLTVGYSARIIMPNTEDTANEISAVKASVVGRSGLGNSITSNTVTFTSDHNFLSGESIRVLSADGRLPDGLSANKIYYAVTDGLSADQIQIAQTVNDVNAGQELDINNFGGRLTVESRVNDKVSGEVGHPIQFDTDEMNWYVNVSMATTENTFYTKLEEGVSQLGEATPRTFIVRNPDTRASTDRIYKYRYVIPSSSNTEARPPIPGYSIQESNSVTGLTDAEVQLYFNTGSVSLQNTSQMRNFSFITTAFYDNGTASYMCEKPHHLSIGSKVQIERITSTNFPNVGVALSGFNGEFEVIGISSQLSFTVANSNPDPGEFTNNVNSRNLNLPTYQRKKFEGTYTIYDVSEVDEYIQGEQDGVYDLIVISSNSVPTVAPFSTTSYSQSQPVSNLYPQFNRDNPNSNPQATVCYALPDEIGQVVVDNPEHSLTREAVDQIYFDARVGTAVTGIISNAVGFAQTIFTAIDHGLNPATRVTINNGGGGYGQNSGATEYYYGVKLNASNPGSLGRNATGLVEIDPSGQIVNVEVMNGGSAYVVGNLMSVAGIPTFVGYSPAELQVLNIIDNRGDSVQIEGITDSNFIQYNKSYEIESIDGINGIGVTPINGSPGVSTEGIPPEVFSGAVVVLTGLSNNVDDLQYDRVSGIMTVTTSNAHGYTADNTVILGGADASFFNGLQVVSEVVGLNTFKSNVGINTQNQVTTGNIKIYDAGLAPQGGEIGELTEDLGGRGIYSYAGVTTTITSGITTFATTVDINNLDFWNLKIGDFLKIDEEIVRIQTTVDSLGGNDTINIFRGVYGTNATNHVAGSVVERIDMRPIELRRNSIIRASGHTFEYIGYGPGNYSTAFPSKQTITLTPTEQLNAQALDTNGGGINYTAMNDNGDYYIGNKKISANGKEQVFNTPVQTITGEDPYSRSSTEKDLGLNYLDSDKMNVTRSVIVDGGDNNDILSEFNGPVSFSKKITSTASEGIEANSLFLQGNALISRKISVSLNQPTGAGNPGDIVYNANPQNGGSVGWVYTVNNEWKTFGTIDS